MLNPHLSQMDDLLCKLDRLTALVWCAQGLSDEPYNNSHTLSLALDEIALNLSDTNRGLRQEWNGLRDDLYGSPSPAVPLSRKEVSP